MVTRNIITLNVATNGKDGDYKLLVNNKKFSSVVYSETVEAIKEALINKYKTDVLFKLAHTDYQVEISKPQWKIALNECINYYSKKEEYERCSEIVKLIKEFEL